MLLQEFNTIIDRMQLALEYTSNLGQNVEAVKILYQMNEHLPDDLKLSFEDFQDPGHVKSFISEYIPKIKSAVAEYRQRLVSF